ncbi:MAG: PilN domain-containing protein [Chitinispirillia bacterium]|nr:PilN domain-containing protein [Chitinispirillia bacterium]MCL2268960.1 PilN domain-containing protein [Chitinispirillia bacterium]
MIERIEINLLPAEYRMRKRTINIPRSIVYPAVALVALLICAALYTLYMKDKESRLNEEIAAINKEIEANKGLQKELNELRENKRITESKIAALKQISVDREKWVRLLEMISGGLPSYSWLISVREEAGPPQWLALEARTYSFPEVAHYMSRLESHELVESVTLTGIEQIDGPDRKVYRYTLNCVLANNLAEPPPVEEDAADANRRGRRGRR